MVASSGRRRFRFSLQATTAGSRTEWVELVHRVDAAGFDLLVTADHLGLGCLSPVIALANAAEVSQRLRLGMMVLNQDFHQPALLARDLASLDLLSDGRVEVGIGAGHAEPEYRAAGLPFAPASARVDRLEETVVVLRQLLNGDNVTYAGRHHQIAGLQLDPRPIQERLPILVGGSGRRVHAIGARHADGIGFSGLGRTLADGQHHEPSGFPQAAVDADVAAAIAAADGRAVELNVMVQAVVVTADPIAAAEQIVATHLPTLSVQDVLDTPYLMVGTRDSLVDKLQQQRERWGFTHYTVRPDALGQVEPVIEALVSS
jgi:probable F420-dependent oxidoreductase